MENDNNNFEKYVVEFLGRPQTKATRLKLSRLGKGKNNSQWKDGRRLDYRKMKGLKKGDKREVSHEDGDRWNNSKSNLKIVSKSKHSKIHKRNLNFKGSGNTKRKWRRKALKR